MVEIHGGCRLLVALLVLVGAGCSARTIAEPRPPGPLARAPVVAPASPDAEPRAAGETDAAPPGRDRVHHPGEPRERARWGDGQPELASQDARSHAACPGGREVGERWRQPGCVECICTAGGEITCSPRACHRGCIRQPPW